MRGRPLADYLGFRRYVAGVFITGLFGFLVAHAIPVSQNAIAGAIAVGRDLQLAAAVREALAQVRNQ